MSSLEMAGFNLTKEEFHLISSLVYEKFGINLGEQKRTLVIERLQKEHCAREDSQVLKSIMTM